MGLTWELADQVWGFQLGAAPWQQCNPAPRCTDLMPAGRGTPEAAKDKWRVLPTEENLRTKAPGEGTFAWTV